MLHDGCSTGPPPTPPPTADYHVTSNTTNTSSPVTQTFPRFHPEASAGAPAPSSCALAMRGCIVKCVNSQAPADMGIDARHVTAAQCGFVVVLSGEAPHCARETRSRAKPLPLHVSHELLAPGEHDRATLVLVFQRAMPRPQFAHRSPRVPGPSPRSGP